MSRSRKSSIPENHSWWVSRPDGIYPDRENDGIGDEKAGARECADIKPRSKKQFWLMADRRMFGSTEKTLRRNRKTWARKFSKEGRQLDKQEIKNSHEEA